MSFLLLETGDHLLLETGFFLLLDDGSVTSGSGIIRIFSAGSSMIIKKGRR